LRPSELIGALAALVLLGSIFLEWFSLTDVPQRDQQDAWICGTGDFSCSGFATFPILRWLLIAACSAPLILAWIIVRGHKLSWPPGEMTAVVGFTAVVLVGYNGVVDKPGAAIKEFGVSLSYGYIIAILAAIAIATCGAWRAVERPAERKAPGTI
jgi:hypothetical protein